MMVERAALNILLKVTQEGAFLNLALKDGLSFVDEREVPFLTALVYTAVEKISFCDYYIERYARGRLHSSIRGILRLALTELFFMETPDYTVCDKYVSLTEKIGKAKLKGFVNGVLRSIARDKLSDKLPPLPSSYIERMSVISGYPDFMIDEYVSDYGEEFTKELVTANLKGVPVRAIFPDSAETVIATLRGDGIEAEKSPYLDDSIRITSIQGSVADNILFRNGRITVQSESAMLACRCLEPGPGMSVLDACAAPGGKTAYIFDLMKRDGCLTAWDIHPHRVELINATLSRLGCSGVNCLVHDASVMDDSLIGSMDRVLCDVPCSGLGSGSKPDSLLRRTRDGVRELSEIQYKILSVCSRYLRPEGMLVYSTCTLSDMENEAVIERFLKENPSFVLAPFDHILPEKLKGRAENGMMRLFPNMDRVEGFFIARIKRLG